MLRLRLDGPELAVGEIHRVERLLGRRQVDPQRGVEIRYEPTRAAFLVPRGKILDQPLHFLDREIFQVVVLRGRFVRELRQFVGNLARDGRNGRSELVHLPPVRVGRVLDELEGDLPEPPLRPDRRAERGEEHLEKRGELRLKERDVGRREGRVGEVAQRAERNTAPDVGEARLEILKNAPGRGEEVRVERRPLLDMVPFRLRERVGSLVELALDGRRLSCGELALLGRRGEVVDAAGERRKRDAEVGRDLLRAVHPERLRRDERGERLVEARGDLGVVHGLLRHVGELADERLDLRGAAVVPEHRLLERGPHGGGSAALKLV